MTRYKWRSGLAGAMPPGVERGKCYDALLTTGPASRTSVVDLLDDDGEVIAHAVSVRVLELCPDAGRGKEP